MSNPPNYIPGNPPTDPIHANPEHHARSLDAADPLSALRGQFIIPTKADLKHQRYGPAPATNVLGANGSDGPAPDNDLEESIYLCGNSLGLQPRRTREYVQRYLDTWASKGVYGHFTELEDGLPPWLHLDDALKEHTSKIVGALPSEVAVMQTLTANLHLLLASFYRPTKDRFRIIIEGKAFPSDHYAVQSQLIHHGVEPDALVTITPQSPNSPYLSTEHILETISKYAATTALVLLPGIQYYSGQFLDIQLITHHCHQNGIIVGWDLAHAVGNVPLKLHDWNVDFAVWCNYKYMNGGPGVIGGLFVHECHGKVDVQEEGPAEDVDEQCTNSGAKNETGSKYKYRPRLSGWWGSDKSTRFDMENSFVPIPGASGFQLSNPSALDMTSVLASLDIFSQTTMDDLRIRSINLTGYLEKRLLDWQYGGDPPYTIITPLKPSERGAQLSILLNPGLLDSVQAYLIDHGVVADERKPDVIRVAPAPLYNSYWDIHRFIVIFQQACEIATASQRGFHNREAHNGNGVEAENPAAPE